MTPKAKTEPVRHHLVAEIDLTAIARNIQTLRSWMEPGCQMCVAIKADAYGHGADLVLPVLAREGVEMVGVATIGEASEAREWGWQGSILLMGSELNGYLGPRQRDRAEWLVANEISSTPPNFRHKYISPYYLDSSKNFSSKNIGLCRNFAFIG